MFSVQYIIKSYLNRALVFFGRKHKEEVFVGRFFNHQLNSKSSNSGLSLIEVIIVIALLALLIILGLRFMPQQIDRARDSKRKSDLDKIKIAFENYYNDYNSYPPVDVLSNCGSSALAPYLSAVPCDPGNRLPYLYFPHPSPSDATGGFRVFAQLSDASDAAISRLGCDLAPGCGLGEEFPGVNYGVSEGVPVFFSDYEPDVVTSGVCCNIAWICNSWDYPDECASSIYPNHDACVLADNGCNN